MGRLIDADALCERIRKIYDGYMLDEGCTPIEFENMVDEQPTAYDIEKVVAELEEVGNQRVENAFGGREEWEALAYRQGTRKAIEIVRKGGVE